MDEYILYVNQNQHELGWNVNPCKLSKSNPMYKKLAYNCEKQVFPQIISNYKDIAKIATNESSYEKAHKEIQKYYNYKNAASIHDKDIPESFDLRNVSGVNYAGEVRN